MPNKPGIDISLDEEERKKRPHAKSKFLRMLKLIVGGPEKRLEINR